LLKWLNTIKGKSSKNEFFDRGSFFRAPSVEKASMKTEVVTIQELKKIDTLLAASARKYFFTSQFF